MLSIKKKFWGCPRCILLILWSGKFLKNAVFLERKQREQLISLYPVRGFAMLDSSEPIRRDAKQASRRFLFQGRSCCCNGWRGLQKFGARAQILHSNAEWIAYTQLSVWMRAKETEFRRLIQRHQAMVFSIALRIVGDRGMAEEVAQDVFVELYEALGRVESEDHVRFWLRRVAAHRSVDCLRRRSLRPECMAEEWTEEHGHYKDGSSARQDAVGMRLEQMLFSLPEGLRVPILLRYQEDMSPDEIARALEQPLATVKSNLQRGLELLRRKAGVVLKEFVRER